VSVRHLASLVLVPLLAAPAAAQSFDCGSNGSDGALDFSGHVGTVIFRNDFDLMFPDADPTNGRSIDEDGDRVYHFTTINVPQGLTLLLSARFFGDGRALTFLASGKVTIHGTIQLSGDSASGVQPGAAGAGGYSGGIGGRPSGIGTFLFPTSGSGPGGGRAYTLTSPFGFVGEPAAHVTGWRPYGHPLIHPLVGGSGGGGGGAGGLPTAGGRSGGGGGGGGGALLLCSSAEIDLGPNGQILAQGGQGGNLGLATAGGGAGSGGAIRLVAPAIKGGAGSSVSAGDGRVRLEAFRMPGPGPSTGGYMSRGGPNAVFLGGTPPGVRLASVAGVAVTLDPTGSFETPDVVIAQSGPVPVVVETQDVPAGTVLQLRFQPENGPEFGASSTPLIVGPDGTGSATAETAFPPGNTRVFVTVSALP
jgi:hypothetical protein